MHVIATAPIHPTEDAATVRKAVEAFFPGDATQSDVLVQVVSHDLTVFRDAVWARQIIDTMRGSLLHGLRDDGFRFHISKQAAAAGKLSLPVSTHALGDIRVEVELEESDRWEDGEALAWWVCPETEEGRIVGPTD